MKAVAINEEQGGFQALTGFTRQGQNWSEADGFFADAYLDELVNNIGLQVKMAQNRALSRKLGAIMSGGGNGGSTNSTTFGGGGGIITPAMVAGYLAYKYQGTYYNFQASLSPGGKGFNYSYTTEANSSKGDFLIGYISLDKLKPELGEIGDGSSLYTTDADLPVHTVEEWAAHYEGKTWNEIATEKPDEARGPFTFKGGPYDDWRFVILRDYRVLDMRHVLVVGMKTSWGFKIGVPAGWVGEKIQTWFAPLSANKKIDYFSNKIGSEFLSYLQKHDGWYNPRYSTRDFGNSTVTRLAQHFLNFINSRK